MRDTDIEIDSVGLEQGPDRPLLLVRRSDFCAFLLTPAGRAALVKEASPLPCRPAA